MDVNNGKCERTFSNLVIKVCDNVQEVDYILQFQRLVTIFCRASFREHIAHVMVSYGLRCCN